MFDLGSDEESGPNLSLIEEGDIEYAKPFKSFKPVGKAAVKRPLKEKRMQELK